MPSYWGAFLLDNTSQLYLKIYSRCCFRFSGTRAIHAYMRTVRAVSPSIIAPWVLVPEFVDHCCVSHPSRIRDVAHYSIDERFTLIRVACRLNPSSAVKTDNHKHQASALLAMRVVCVLLCKKTVFFGACATSTNRTRRHITLTLSPKFPGVRIVVHTYIH